MLRRQKTRQQFMVELEQHTSITVPFVITPNCVDEVPVGFFLTPRMLRQNVHLSSG